MGQGRHSKPNETTTSMKMVAIGATVIGATVVPATFAGPASAATDAQWEAVAVPEAGGNWSINHSGDGLSVGGLQFQNASWQDALAYLRSKGIDTSSFPASLYQGMANVPTKAQQMLAGEALLHLQGRGAWANGNGSGLSASMFDGGPIPATVAASGLLNGSPYGTATPTPTPTPTPTTPPPAPAAGDTYTVKAGDYLAKIATALQVEGGWQKLYELNKAAIGPNPNLIRVGLILKLPVKADPYAGGLPVVDSKIPSAKPLQEELKRVGILDTGIPASDNYGPETQAGVSYFHKYNPQFISSGKTWSEDVQIGPKGWAFLRGMKPVGSGSDDPAPAPTPPPASSGYVAPCTWTYVGDNLIVGSGGSMSRSAGGHSGLDLIAPQGTKVVSVAAGLVVSINASGGAYGNHVVVKHADGKYTLYAHLSAITTSVGRTVTSGQQIGNVGSTGNSNGPHLHFEVRTHPTDFSSGIFLDPKVYLRSHGVTI